MVQRARLGRGGPGRSPLNSREPEGHDHEHAQASLIAFLPTLGWQEMFLPLVICLLLYGHDLPEAGRGLGRLVAQMKRGFE